MTSQRLCKQDLKWPFQISRQPSIVKINLMKKEKRRKRKTCIADDQGGITCEAIDEPRKSSKAIDKRVIINFRDKNVVIARFCNKNEVFFHLFSHIYSTHHFSIIISICFYKVTFYFILFYLFLIAFCYIDS